VEGRAKIGEERVERSGEVGVGGQYSEGGIDGWGQRSNRRGEGDVRSQQEGVDPRIIRRKGSMLSENSRSLMVRKWDVMARTLGWEPGHKLHPYVRRDRGGLQQWQIRCDSVQIRKTRLQRKCNIRKWEPRRCGGG